MFGSPAAATRVGKKSRPDMMPFSTFPAGMWPGQRAIIGTRMPPSMIVPLPAANGVLPPSGQVKFSVPLSVVNTTIVLLSSPSAFSLSITPPTTSSSCDITPSSRYHWFSAVSFASIFRRQMRDDVHAGGIHPDEERLAVLSALSMNFTE